MDRSTFLLMLTSDNNLLFDNFHVAIQSLNICIWSDAFTFAAAIKWKIRNNFHAFLLFLSLHFFAAVFMASLV